MWHALIKSGGKKINIIWMKLTHQTSANLINRCFFWGGKKLELQREKYPNDGVLWSASCPFHRGNGVKLTVFPQVSSLHQVRDVAVVCWESAEAVCWDPPHFFFPCSKVKTPPQLHRQRGEKKMNGEANKAPHWKPVLQLSHMSYSPTMRGKPLRGQRLTATADPQKHWICGRLQNTLSVSFPSRWRVITYILPKIRICSFCHVYTNSDLQGEYRWQVIRVQLQRDKRCSLLHFSSASNIENIKVSF